MITVLIPTHDHAQLLPFALRSVQQQTIHDVEILIVGDGVGDDTREAVQPFLTDARVRFFDYPKGKRHGETYRHEVLRQARGGIVCYQSDDDLWAKDHLETLAGLLAISDFAHTIAVEISANGERKRLQPRSDISGRRQLLDGDNFIPLSCAGHTLAAYRGLPHGWRTTPEGTYVDLHMWRQFISRPIRFRSGETATVLHFPSSQRKGWTQEERVVELQGHWWWTA